MAVPDIAWIGPCLDPCLTSPQGLFNQSSADSRQRLGSRGHSVASLGLERVPGKTGDALVEGTSDESAGITNLRQVDFGMRGQDLAVPHVAALAPSSIHLVGRLLPIRSRPLKVPSRGGIPIVAWHLCGSARIWYTGSIRYPR